MQLKKLFNKIRKKIVNEEQSTNDIQKIFWKKTGKNNKNFGDLITSYIYLKKTGKKPIWWNGRETKDPVLFGSGSIMYSCKNWKNVIIWGTGIMYSNETFDKPAIILSVRGPFTRKRFLELGYDCPKTYGDIGLLLPKFYNMKSNKKYKIGIIPHFVDFELCKKLFSKLDNLIVIDVCKDVEEVVNNICKCELTISSSLHGIIVSHAYNIKSCWAKFSQNISGDDIKYLDYYYSVNLENIKPLIIGEEFKLLPNKIEHLIENVKNYPNPNFPIDTEKLLKTCPF